MVNSGAHFYRRYSKLVDENTPFVRAGGQERVVESAQKWLVGVAQSLNDEPPEIDLIIPEGTSWNNTLSHDTCPAFESGPDHGLGDRAQRIWADKFVPPIQQRINSALGTNLSATSTVYLMDMCPLTLLHTAPQRFQISASSSPRRSGASTTTTRLWASIIATVWATPLDLLRVSDMSTSC
ncbi:hypothetical protein P3342_006229 [Pyrenophora teres f. teres]|nr:hypothetical protein P3342_006229 [Pyrenophora teres f. teres]